MGDAMCQMRGLKEYKDRNPGTELDFVSCHYLHYLMASHTDLFKSVKFVSQEEVNGLANSWQGNGYEKLIEFIIDWGAACRDGILRAWTEKTLGFTPSTDKPYFLLNEEEKVTARNQHSIVMNHPQPNKPTFRKSMVLQLESVSCNERGFLLSDWNRIVDMIPPDVAIFYMPPITWIHGNPFPPRPNLIVLPGYPVGETGAMMQMVDVVFTVHSGPLMLAYACDAKCIIQIGFNEAGSPNLLKIPEGQGENLFIDTNRSVDWNQIQSLINKYLA
jgi:hypothetical protein